VTDNGSNVKSAFKDLSWLGCSGHNLNLVLSHTFSDEDSKMEINDILQLLSVCKNIVRYVKKSRIQTKLETSVKPAVATRWNSNLRMLQSVSKNVSRLRDIANDETDKKLQRLLIDVNDQLLTEVIDILRPFDDATRMLSADKTPTLHLVIAGKVQLKKHLVAKSSDSSVGEALKSRLASKLDVYYHVQQLHKVAAVLDPRLKGSVLTESDKQAAVLELKSLVT